MSGGYLGMNISSLRLMHWKVNQSHYRLKLPWASFHPSEHTYLCPVKPAEPLEGFKQ